MDACHLLPYFIAGTSELNNPAETVEGKAGRGRKPAGTELKLEPGPKRNKFVRDFMQSQRASMKAAYRRAGVEYITVIFDPLTMRIDSQQSIGLRGVWGDVEVTELVPAVHEYNSEIGRMNAAMWGSLPGGLDQCGWEPLHFNDIPGGRSVQQRATIVLLMAAVPQGFYNGRIQKTFWEKTTTEKFRSLRWVPTDFSVSHFCGAALFELYVSVCRVSFLPLLIILVRIAPAGFIIFAVAQRADFLTSLGLRTCPSLSRIR